MVVDPLTGVTFTIPGKITSANRVTRRVENMSLKSASARDDTQRIGALALAARLLQGWIVPEVAWLNIVAYNSRLDVGNIEKVVGDGIKARLLIIDDNRKHLRRLLVTHRDDDQGERYVVTVSVAPNESPEANPEA